MSGWRRPAAILVLAAILGAGCAASGPRAVVAPPPAARPVQEYIVYSSTTWSGDLVVTRPIVVTKTGSLTLQPGTRLHFQLPEPEAGKERPPWILVMGSLVALGTPEQPILFRSVELRTNELDDMIHVAAGKEVHLRHCAFERGPWGVHVHDTRVDIAHSEFRGNYGGVRFQGGKVELRQNRFADNQIGVRSLNGAPVLEGNTFVGNRTGIFFRQGIEGAVLRRNNFDNLEYDLKLGEAQTQDVDARENWWKAAAAGQLAARLYDRTDDPALGFIRTEPLLPAPWAPPVKKP